MALVVTDQTFEKEVLSAKEPVVVDFWAEWCPPCRVLSPIVDELAKEYEGRVKIAKVNVDENPKTPAKYGIMSIPTLIIFKNGTPQQTLIGVQPKEKIKEEIEKII